MAPEANGERVIKSITDSELAVFPPPWLDERHRRIETAFESKWAILQQSKC